MKQRVLVCGGRDYSDATLLGGVLDGVHAAGPIECVIHGGARGADRLAGEWAESKGVPHMPYLADWNTQGLAAGPIRNQRMLDEGKPSLVVAFHGGRGTADMIRRAEKAGVPVVRAGRAALTEESGATNEG